MRLLEAPHTQEHDREARKLIAADQAVLEARGGAVNSNSNLKETTGGEFRVYRASIRLL